MRNDSYLPPYLARVLSDTEAIAGDCLLVDLSVVLQYGRGCYSWRRKARYIRVVYGFLPGRRTIRRKKRSCLSLVNPSMDDR